MNQTQIGARQVQVSRLFFGTLTMGPLQRNLPVERGAELLCYAAARGVTSVDTAEFYHTYPYVREALKVYPGLAVCTKSYAYDLDGAKRSVELAQEGIGRQRIDIFLMHEQESEHTLRGHAEAFAYYVRLREEGIIGAVGISTHYIAAVRAASRWPGMDVVFPIINQRGLGIADGSRQEMEQAIAQASGKGLFTLAMKALGGGHLIAQRREAMRYVLGLQGIDAVAVGMQSEAEIDYNIALVQGQEPDARMERETADAVRTLIVQNWCEGCGRCVKRCRQKALRLENGRAQVEHGRCVRCGYCAGVCPLFCLKVI